MSDKIARDLTEKTLINETQKIVKNYMKIYDEYYILGSRESAFLKDLADSLLGISAVLEVYARNKEIEPDYAISKLEHSKSYIETTICFFKSRLEEEK